MKAYGLILVISFLMMLINLYRRLNYRFNFITTRRQNFFPHHRYNIKQWINWAHKEIAGIKFLMQLMSLSQHEFIKFIKETSQHLIITVLLYIENLTRQLIKLIRVSAINHRQGTRLWWIKSCYLMAMTWLKDMDSRMVKL